NPAHTGASVWREAYCGGLCLSIFPVLSRGSLPKSLALPPTQSAAEGLLQGNFGLVVLFGGDFVLGALGFQLEQLFFQRLQQQRGTITGRSATQRARSAR